MAETESLPCALTDDEVAARAAELAQLVKVNDAIEAKKKAEAEKIKEELGHVAGNIRRLAKQVRERSEDRDVEVEERWDDIRCCVETIRTDTFEVVRSRPMTQASGRRDAGGARSSRRSTPSWRRSPRR
jgi:hypothetical protein